MVYVMRIQKYPLNAGNCQKFSSFLRDSECNLVPYILGPHPVSLEVVPCSSLNDNFTRKKISHCWQLSFKSNSELTIKLHKKHFMTSYRVLHAGVWPEFSFWIKNSERQNAEKPEIGDFSPEAGQKSSWLGFREYVSMCMHRLIKQVLVSNTKLWL